MEKVLTKIAKANETELEGLLRAVLRRHAELYPMWELQLLTIEKTKDCNAQIDRVIALLERMKSLEIVQLQEQ